MSEKSPKNIKNTCKTNIYKFRANSKKTQQVNPSPFKSAQVPWTYFFFDLLIRARTGSFANVCRGASFENIKLGQIFGSSKNGSWALVDARNFFFDLLIRACTGSFANVFGGATLENIKLGQIFGSSKNGSWALVDAHNFFF